MILANESCSWFEIPLGPPFEKGGRSHFVVISEGSPLWKRDERYGWREEGKMPGGSIFSAARRAAEGFLLSDA
jgi:hypothetical protein